jgi:hypothetical protein
LEEVCKIRLSNTMEDTIAWHYERHGVFTVKSAYRLAVQADQAEKLSMGEQHKPRWEPASVCSHMVSKRPSQGMHFRMAITPGRIGHSTKQEAPIED